ncbi:unnamed protein product [Thelazia callipaeda]|uniref:G_PROTEIN_RECEP_F1_2 domain-containing protein n=1 Tax=Thelazia callipaeda TaxID=103827 RepID=A0A0N5D033_THECL|nr:unnamed protein product [Thelazia callipaeda]
MDGNDSESGLLTVISDNETESWSFRRLTAFGLVLIPCATIFGNTLVIVAVFCERSLHSVTNHFIVSLALADFLIALCVMSFATYFEMNSYIWGLGPFMCNLYMATDVALSTASILNLLAISVDRYAAIAWPLIYVKLSSSWKRPKVMVSALWIISIIVGLPILLGVNHHADDRCEFTNAVFIIISSLLSFFLPCTAIVILYTVILFRLHQRKKDKYWKCVNEQPIRNELSGMLTSRSQFTAMLNLFIILHFIHKFKCRSEIDGATTKMDAIKKKFFGQKQSKRQVFKITRRKLRRERKATITLAVVLGVFLFCWLPFFTLHTINAVCILQVANNCIHFNAFFLTTWLGYFNSSLNPLIYTLFDRRFRKVFRRILPCGKR